MKNKTITASFILLMMMGLQNLKAQIQQSQSTQSSTVSNQSDETMAFKKGDFTISLNVAYLTVFSFDNTFTSGGTPLGLHLGLAVSNHVTIGFEAGYSELQTTTTNTFDAYGNPYSYYYNVSIVYYMADLQWHWLVKPRYSLYSGLALGGLSVSSSYIQASGPTESITTLSSISGLAYQLTAVGWRSMGKHFGGHFEIGYGNKGIFTGGVDLRF